MLRKPARRAQQLGPFLREGIHEGKALALDERLGNGLAIQLLELGLVIEQLQLAGPAGHEQIDHTPGPGREMSFPGRQRIGERGGAPGEDPAVAEQGCQPQRAEPKPTLAEEMPARQPQSGLVQWSHFSAPSWLSHRLIQIQDQTCNAGVSSQFFNVQLLVLLRVAVIQKTCGSFPVAALAVLKSFQRVEH